MEGNDRGVNEHPAQGNLSQTFGSAIFGGIDISSNVQEQIPSAFCSGECEEYEDDRGSSLLSTKMRKTREMSEKFYNLLCKMFSAVPERTKENLESILGKKFMG